jgi:hypothetical protein
MIHLPVAALGSIITSDARRAARCARGSAERGSRSSDSRQAGAQVPRMPDQAPTGLDPLLGRPTMVVGLGARAGMLLSVSARKTANVVSRLADQLERSDVRDRLASFGGTFYVGKCGSTR